MPKDYAILPPTQVRRSDRAITDVQWITDFVRQAAVGTFATEHNGQPFLNSNLFAYSAERHAIYFHTANVGRTKANVEQNPKVCFTVFSMGRLLPAAEALEFSVEYQSVVAFGTVQVVEETGEAEYGLQLLMDKYAPHLRPDRDYRPIQLEEIRRTGVFRMDITEWVGKRKKVADDFPGAFWYSPADANS
ncbi:MAG TPA: pyridoxamine 5'-phosphate oxidase family protein [Anaerolineales bacterium]|nr:pyridoxamine 5'-phosphate oxidase family protein [Anaerolineales bacterium]